MTRQIDSAKRLRELLRLDRPLRFAGVYDALGARIAERAGFDGLWVSGYAVSASLMGTPDMGLITLNEMVDRTKAFIDSPSVQFRS